MPVAQEQTTAHLGAAAPTPLEQDKPSAVQPELPALGQRMYSELTQDSALARIEARVEQLCDSLGKVCLLGAAFLVIVNFIG